VTQNRYITCRMMNRLRENLATAEQQKMEAEQRADRWEKIKTVRSHRLRSTHFADVVVTN
jgi:protein subunit release factor A